MYRTNSEALGWFAVLLWAIIALAAVLAVRAHRTLASAQKKYYWLLVSMAFIPLLLMILASMPPLRSALVDRYIMPSVAFMVALLGVIIALTIGTRKKWNKPAATLLVLVVGAMVSGIVYVYQIGNMNKDAGNDTQLIWPTLQLVWEPTVSVCLILDPMLATGGSATATVDVLKRWGAVTPVGKCLRPGCWRFAG